MDGIDSIIGSLEERRTAIERAIASLRGIGGGQVTKRRGRPPGVKKSTVSSEGRQRQIEAMRRYWAAKKAGAKKSAG
ncbi:MAG: hypothetical protein KIT09_36055 [Bryobacteraceae bacterium]|nr:hypothetical protein [Bryobacteraceae bacterium]